MTAAAGLVRIGSIAPPGLVHWWLEGGLPGVSLEVRPRAFPGLGWVQLLTRDDVPTGEDLWEGRQGGLV